MAESIEKYNVELTGDEVKKRLHRDVIFKLETDWNKDNTAYSEGSLLVYTVDDNGQTRIKSVKLADGEHAADDLPSVNVGGQSYWKNLD